jgi:superfamily II DNA or RNA helicase
VDEAHHALSDSYKKILEYFSAHVLGVTATPDRGDMKSLGEFFESLAYEYTLVQAIREGYLCPIKAQTIPLKIDLSGVRTQQGDYASGDLGDALSPYLDQIADIIAQKYADRKTVAFLPLVSTSQEFKNKLCDRGVRAWEVNGNSKDRAEVLETFNEATNGVLCNSMLLTEGWDCPSVDCIVILRPTKIRSLYTQMVGRGTRLCEGKDHLLLLDFLWLTRKHELCRSTCLICKKEQTAQLIDDRMAETGEVFELNEQEIEKAEADVKRQREAALAEQLKKQRMKKAKLVDPLQFEMSIMDEDLQDYEPVFGWEMEEATEKQKQTIEKFGINPGENITKGYASMLLDRLMKRADAGLTSAKQIRCLERFGFREVGTWAFDDANRIIKYLAAHNWALPYNIDPQTYIPKSQRG